MFENVLGQPTVQLLAADFQANSLPPASLFSGPANSGKGTTALELARVLSCEKTQAAWNCDCSACNRHRSLVHADLLLMGRKDFRGELGAAAAAFQREPQSSARLLFFRAVQKLLARFNPILWEGEDSRLAKAAGPLSIINDHLDDLSVGKDLTDRQVEALILPILKAAQKLEADFLPASVPIFQVRRAAYWTRLAPIGRKKLVVIENIDNLQEGARNALLKILEEPPEHTMLVLSCLRRGAVMPTILSRVRNYVFINRDLESQRAIIRRVFRDPAAAEKLDLATYLDSFQPVTQEGLVALASLFAASVSAAVLERCQQAGRRLPDSLAAFNQRCIAATSAELSSDARVTVARVMDQAEGFTSAASFAAFLVALLELWTPVLAKASDPDLTGAAQLWRDELSVAATAVNVYNQTPVLALEGLFINLTTSLAGRANNRWRGP